jgi:hypothetical protein
MRATGIDSALIVTVLVGEAIAVAAGFNPKAARDPSKISRLATFSDELVQGRKFALGRVGKVEI